jgi:hypothetical protein
MYLNDEHRGPCPRTSVNIWGSDIDALFSISPSILPVDPRTSTSIVVSICLLKSLAMKICLATRIKQRPPKAVFTSLVSKLRCWNAHWPDVARAMKLPSAAKRNSHDKEHDWVRFCALKTFVEMRPAELAIAIRRLNIPDLQLSAEGSGKWDSKRRTINWAANRVKLSSLENEKSYQ